MEGGSGSRLKMDRDTWSPRRKEAGSIAARTSVMTAATTRITMVKSLQVLSIPLSLVRLRVLGETMGLSGLSHAYLPVKPRNEERGNLTSIMRTQAHGTFLIPRLHKPEKFSQR